MQQDIKIQPMTADNVQAVAQIEAECFSEPWSLAGLEAELTNPLAVFLTAAIDDITAGYGGMHCVAGCGYITNIAVLPAFHRMGIGAAILASLIAHGKANKLEAITLEVRTSNLAAISLYQKFGFAKEGIRPNFYSKPREDAMIMTLKL